ncbi:pyridoxal phosphate-dependent transferase [Chaetomium tenue]|uniref:Pyridoxal phosphate-dependent transferase n=1 Tax=Chaetomium tenue TaxID=1854479 RepID=A0ACB7PP20_9PEZI|nr:pyridoxal phosphate-dependent transferase [Chaetomium globosum]
MATIPEPENLPLGISLPPGDPHGVSVHLPKWADTVGWASREPRVLEAMKTGYPRFFVPRVVHQLAMRLLAGQQSDTAFANDIGIHGEGEERLATLLNAARHGKVCRETLAEWSKAKKRGAKPPYIGVYAVAWDGKVSPVQEEATPDESRPASQIGEEDIILVTYPAELAPEAKSFWQHTGYGISSRRATYWLEHAPFLADPASSKPSLSPAERSLSVIQARAALKEQIATGQSSPSHNLHVAPSDVFLFSSGMTAITELATAIKSLRPPTPGSPYRVAVFGFLYVDTFKVLSRILNFTPTLYHYSPPSLTALSTLLTHTHIDAVFTEFPGNPLLQTPDLTQLSHLARQHAFTLVVDDTVGTHASVRTLRVADVVCSSLTKMFSGGCNVMGGVVVLNPGSGFYGRLRGVLERGREEAEGAWFGEDVVVMEGNGRDFGGRVERVGRNAEVVVGVLRGSAVVREVYYPLGGPTQELYDRFRVEGGRYGFLVSIRFREKAQAVAFYDALDVAKGPSLGTNFTLCCAYTLLAHYNELEWAAEYGVVEDLVRISVGLEDRAWLEERVGRALKAAEGVVVGEGRGIKL